MYRITKTFTISAAHKLALDYRSKCSELHGHNWKITVSCQNHELDQNCMVADFSHIKKNICDMLDHKNLNDVMGINPTAENMAEFIYSLIPNCVHVTVEEQDGSIAEYWLEDQ